MENLLTPEIKNSLEILLTLSLWQHSGKATFLNQIMKFCAEFLLALVIAAETAAATVALEVQCY